MKKLLLFLSIFTFPLSLFAAVYTPQTVPDPKRLGQDCYVANPDTILPDSVVDWMNLCARRLNDSTMVELAVVAIRSIGDADAFNFSYELFQRWGIGGKGRNTGVLILFVLDSHDLQIRTGTGIEGVLTDARCSQIMHDDMFPAFREGDYAGGLCIGMLDIYETCTQGDAPEELLTIRSVTNHQSPITNHQSPITNHQSPITNNQSPITKSLAILIVTSLFALPLLLLVLVQGRNRDAMSEMRQRKGCLLSLVVACICFPFLIPAALWFWWRSKRLRCPQCGRQQYRMVKRDRHIDSAAETATYTYHFVCSACGYVHDEVETTDISSAGGDYDSGSYDSGSSYSGGGGGSWGGGSTSGGGAGGRW